MLHGDGRVCRILGPVTRLPDVPQGRTKMMACHWKILATGCHCLHAIHVNPKGVRAGYRQASCLRPAAQSPEASAGTAGTGSPTAGPPGIPVLSRGWQPCTDTWSRRLVPRARPVEVVPRLPDLRMLLLHLPMGACNPGRASTPGGAGRPRSASPPAAERAHPKQPGERHAVGASGTVSQSFVIRGPTVHSGDSVCGWKHVSFCSQFCFF